MNNNDGITSDGNEHADSLGVRLCDLGLGPIAGFSDSDFGDCDTDNFGVAGIQSSDLGVSYSDESASGFNLELTDAESAIIRLAQGKIAGPRGRTKTTKAEKIYITHEDFEEGPERDSFLLIFGYAEHLFEGPDKKPFDDQDPKKHKALRFFFCPSKTELNLEDVVACIDDQIRTDVLRLRFMLEFWLRGWQIPLMPDDADGLPSRIELMAARHESMIGVALAREAWFEPGIHASVLISRVLDGRGPDVLEKIKQAFKALVIDYVLSIADGSVYTTGKNPILELEDRLNDPSVRVRNQLANIYWSRRF